MAKITASINGYPGANLAHLDNTPAIKNIHLGDSAKISIHTAVGDVRGVISREDNHLGVANPAEGVLAIHLGVVNDALMFELEFNAGDTVMMGGALVVELHQL